MAQNRKKGMAKRALSVSLVAAMLATSNTPAWASGFMNENEDGVQAFFNEISNDEVVKGTVALQDTWDTTGLESKLTAVEWDKADAQLKEAREELSNVVGGVVKPEKTELILLSGVPSDEPEDNTSENEIEVISETRKIAASDIGKYIGARIYEKTDSEPTYVFAGTAGTIGAVDVEASNPFDKWSVTVNNTTFTQDSATFSIPYADSYKVTAFSVTLKNGTAVSEKDFDAVRGVDADITANVVKITFANSDYKKGLDGEWTTGITLVPLGQTFENVTFSGTLTYNPDFNALKPLIDEMATVKDLKVNTHFEVKAYRDLNATNEITVSPKAGDKVYLAVTGKTGTEYENHQKVISAAYTVAKKDLRTLVFDQAAADKIVYDADTAQIFEDVLTSYFKYDAADTAAADYFETTVGTYTTGVKVQTAPTNALPGEKMTITITAEDTANYANSKTVSFTPVVNGFPIAGSVLQNALNTATFEYDGNAHSVNNLITGDLDDGAGNILRRDQFELTCAAGSSLTNAGTYEIVLNGKGAYAGHTLKGELVISQRDLSVFKNGKGITADTVVYDPTVATGTDNLKGKVNPVLKYNNVTLVPGKDYVLAKEFVATGAAGEDVKIKIEGSTDPKSNFTMTAADLTVTVGKVVAMELKDLIPDVPAQKYVDDLAYGTAADTAFAALKATDEKGKEVDYSSLLLDRKEALTLGNDFTVTMTLPKTGEGTATLNIKGKGNYTGYITKTFEITKAEINATFQAKTTDSYTTILPELTYDSKDAADKDGITYSLGTTPAAKEIYTGTSLAGLATDAIVVLNEKGENVAGNCVFTYKNNTEAGTATITATGKPGFNVNAIATFKIAPKVITDTAVDFGNVETEYSYTGEAIKPAAVLLNKSADTSLNDGTYVLKEGVDYELSYEDNVKVSTGKAKVIATGLGNYAFGGDTNVGVETTFDIIETLIKDTDIFVGDVVYAGGLEVAPEIIVKNPVTGKELVKDVDYNVTLTDAVNAGVATATIDLIKDAVDGYNFITAASDTVDVKFVIKKKNLSECSATVVDGKVVVKNGEITVPETEYTVTENEDGSFTVKAAEKNYTGTITVSPVAAPAATQAKIASKTTSSVEVAWDAVEGAEGYTIWYHSEKDTKNARKVLTGGDVTSWTHKGLAAGTKYFYTVKAWVKNSEGKYVFGEETSYVRGTTMPMKAKIAKVTAADGMVKVALADAAAGAEKYSMCYSKSSDFASFKVGVRTSYTTRTFTNALTKGTYYVRVKSYRDLNGGKRIYGAWSNTVKVVVK